VRDPIPTIVSFLTDLERLKLVNRRAYVSDRSRRENSAEGRCIERLASYGLSFGAELRALWLEYEAQQTPESRCATMRPSCMNGCWRGSRPA
jgi:5'-deoxynucleotidase YfbR-like HD superfamily hydrolase